MPTITANGVQLDYDTWGPAGAPAALLINGLGAQRIRWPDSLLQGLVDKGFRVIAHDNRDVGLSQKFDHAGPPDLRAIVAALREGRKPEVAYTLSDMAADAAELLGALGVEKAHIIGASMGGMIAQLVAAEHPHRTLSLTSIFSTTSDPSLPPASPEAIATLNTPAPDPAKDLEAYLDHQVKSAKVNGSPAYPTPDAQLRERARAYVERCYYPVGFARQYAAIMGSPPRREACARITAPTLVIHGDADPLVPVSGGRDTAAHIKDAELMIIEGMGHDLPEVLMPRLVEAIARNAARAG